ncbi:rhodanese-related sulfurtransferase [Neisseria sp. HSC-16F19]|nr:rhodanese-like domain-containing protein [Neisseria sp. HSC-16F19]MCP2041477.1 rhodanese-related sulfurtransferase [Neisseria sp. HSC-16F19]
MSIPQLSPAEVASWQQQGRDFVLLDVREADEVAFAALDGHTHIPMHMVPLRHNELPDDVPLVVYCHHGVRSFQVAAFLKQAGFEEVYNLAGGIDAWSLQIDAAVPRY